MDGLYDIWCVQAVASAFLYYTLYYMEFTRPYFSKTDDDAPGVQKFSKTKGAKYAGAPQQETVRATETVQIGGKSSEQRAADRAPLEIRNLSNALNSGGASRGHHENPEFTV